MTLPLSGASYINALISGWSWTGRVGISTGIDYTIRATSEIDVDPALRGAVINAMREFTSVANISFDYQLVSSLNNQAQQSRVVNNANNLESVPIIFDAQDSVGAGFLGVTEFPFATSGPPSESLITAADVNVGTDGTTLNVGDEGFVTLLHELGHALGLAHPDTGESQDGTTLSGAEQTTDATVMNSTFPDFNPGDITGTIRPSSLMIYDIAALQYLYGANRSYHAGNDVYEYNGTITQARTLWDAGGVDMLSTIGYAGDVVIDLREGFQNVTEVGNAAAGTGSYIWLAFGSNIENARSGQGSDTIFGNSLGNVITSGKSGDSVSGAQGNDDINGNLGNDTVLGGDGEDFVRGGKDNDLMRGGNGNDTVMGNLGDDLLLGGAGNDQMNGNDGSDIVSGDDGNDTIRGGQGDDQLFGGTGNDVVSGDKGNDRLNGGAGADIFAFMPGFGVDTIEDFEGAGVGPGDRLQISSLLAATVDDVLARVSILDTATIVDFGGGNLITLLGVIDIAPDDFLIA